MILELFIILLTCASLYFLEKYWKIHRLFDERGVKYLPGFPIFGNVFRSTLGMRHWNDDIGAVYKAFPDERYVGFIEYMTPIILVRDPELVKAVIIKDCDNFIDHKQFFPDAVDPLLADSIFMMKGERWRHMRATLTPSFTGAKLRNMFGFMMDVTDNIMEYLKENVNKAQETNVEDLARRYTSDVIASAGFGLQTNSVKDRENDFFMLGSSFLKLTSWQWIAMVCPDLAKLFGVKILPKKVTDFFMNILENTVEFRKKNNVERPDMIQLLMEHSTEWSFVEMAAQVFLFFIAGFESPASALTMCLHELALNPDVQEKLYREIKEFHKKHKGLTYDNFQDLKYLECVLNETLRKWSEVPVLDRVSIREYELPPPYEGGKPYIVSPGDIVYAAGNVMHWDPLYFRDPETFDPERFNEDNKPNIIPYTYKPFGTGPRSCVAKKFAKIQLKVFVYHLLLHFKLVRCARTMDPIQLEPLYMNIRPKHGSWITLKPRM